jgi:uncharacterized repeat protein (TIGR01451 family)
MRFLLLVCLLIGASPAVFSQNGTLTVHGDSTLVSCDSLLSISLYNVQTPPTISGDFILTSSSTNSGSYSISVSANWGDGSTTTHQATANNINAGNLISFIPALQHYYTAFGTYDVYLNFNSTNGGPSGYAHFVYTHIDCNTMMVPTTGNNTVPCGTNTMLYDAGGATGNYSSNSSGYTILSNSGTSQISISGNYTYLESYYDTLKIFAGAGNGGQLLYAYNGTSGGTIVPFTSQPGQTLTVQLISDIAVNGAGFAMQVEYSGGCAPITYQVYATGGLDCDNNGIPETTINSGIPFTLSNSSNSYSGTITAGNYMIPSIAYGTYVFAVDPAWLNANGYVINAITPSTLMSVTGSGADSLYISFGCAASSALQCVNGTIFNDANNNGVMDNGENPVANAPVVIEYNGQDYVTYSANNGNYSLTYNGTSGDTIWVGLNSNWLSINGCNSNSGTYALSTACIPGTTGTPINLGIQCTTNTPTYCYSGYVFCDANSNGMMNLGEVGIPFAPVYLCNSSASGNTVVVYTDSSGYYSYCGQIGTTNSAMAWLNTQWMGYQGYSSNSPFITVTGSSNGTTSNGNLAVNCGGTPCNDLWTSVTPWIGYYQNSTAYIKLNWGTNGPLPAGNYQLTFTYPAGITLNTASIQNGGYTISGNTITWNLSSTSSYFSNYDILTFQIPGGLVNGAQHYFTSTIAPIAGNDCNLVNNGSNLLQILGNSYDPNDKTVMRPDAYSNTAAPIEALEGTVIDKLTYTIRFQNTGSAPAQNIVIIDTLSANLDWSTFELIAASHPVQLVHDANGVVHFEFNQIWLADSASNEPASHGELMYSIAEANTCGNGCAIENTAYIYFDWNTPIITNTTYNLNGDLSAGNLEKPAAFRLYPNPTNDKVQLMYNGSFAYSCYDLLGNLIVKGTGINNQEIDLTQVETGMYVIQVTTQDGNHFTQRVTRK